MYLSTLILDPESPRVLSEMQLPYEMHRSLTAAFTDKVEDARPLFRADISGKGFPFVFVQSRVEPDWSDLRKAAGYLLDAKTEPYAPTIRKGAIYRFRLLARPSKRIKESGRRITLRTEEECELWLMRKADSGGFKVLACGQATRKWRDSKGGVATQELSAIQFDGKLEVTDPAAFKETLENGIGTQKAFGFGLLTISREDDCR